MVYPFQPVIRSSDSEERFIFITLIERSAAVIAQFLPSKMCHLADHLPLQLDHTSLCPCCCTAIAPLLVSSAAVERDAALRME